MPTKRQLNWTGVGFTPGGGTLLTISGVTNVAIDPGGNILKFSGDNDHAPTTVVNDFTDPSITVTAADLAALNSLPPGTRGVFTATHRDAKGATGGSIVVTLTNAIVANNPTGGAHRQFGQGTLTLNAESADGSTSALSTSLV